jgi:putative transposase
MSLRKTINTTTPMNIKAQKQLGFNSDKELADFLLANLTDSLKQSVRITVKIMIKQEMESLRAEMNDKLSFNGYYERNMLSPAGAINDINIPRFRERPTSDLPLKSLDIFNGERDKFFRLVAEMHRLGISQRKVKQLCETCLGVNISKTRVGLVHRELAKREELQINNQALDDDFQYLLADGLWVKCKTYGLKADNQAVLLCVLGVRPDGRRKIIAFRLAKKEDFESWSQLLQDIKRRGIAGQNLQLIIGDHSGGLTQALGHIYPQIDVQTCIVHKMRNVLAQTRHKNKPVLGEDLKAIYRAQTKKEAGDRFQSFCHKWYVAEPRAVASLRFDFDKTLTYFKFPRELWSRIRTTNILEREFREVRRRIKVFDSSFNDNRSANTYANSIFDNLNHHYPADLLHTKS